MQVSATTAALLREAGVHTLEYRGKVAAKGCVACGTYEGGVLVLVLLG